LDCDGWLVDVNRAAREAPTNGAT